MDGNKYPQATCGYVYKIPHPPKSLKSYPQLSTGLCGYSPVNPLINPKGVKTLNKYLSFPQSYPQCAQQ